MDDMADKRRRQDFEDQQNELAGRDTGRMTRFGVGEGSSGAVRERERKERAYRDALARLLAENPEYRALFEDLSNRLGQAESQADATIEAIRTALNQTQEADAEIRSRAPKIDGVAVFRYADGQVVDEDGNDIDPLIAEGIIWPDGAPSAQDYFDGRAREAELVDALSDWEAYRNDTLGGIRNRYDDRDNPMSMDDMRDALAEIDAAMPSPTIHAEHAETDVQRETALNASAFPSFDN